jgi:guanyl-specific ribonuclease Sa
MSLVTRVRLAVATLAVVTALPATAQPIVTATFLGSPRAVTAFGVRVGPYDGRINGQFFDFFCVDYFNGITANTTYQAYLTNLGSGDLSKTRFGAMPNAVERYRQAAWLSQQFAVNAQSHWDAIHSAMWNIMTPSAPDVTNAGADNTMHWMSQAAAHSGTLSLSAISVVTDVRVSNPNWTGATLQEQVTVTPEPGTWALLGTGFAGLAVAARRRRRA